MAVWLPNPRSVPRCHLQLATLQVEGCKMPSICELPQGSAPEANTCRARSTPLRLSDVSRARHARTRRNNTYHRIYINLSNNSSYPSFLYIHSPCVSSPRLLPLPLNGSVRNIALAGGLFAARRHPPACPPATRSGPLHTRSYVLSGVRND